MVYLTLGTVASTSTTARAAGLLCGTVRDALTRAGVQGAEVKVYETSGVYAGYSAATDAVGHFCIPAIPAGLYDLQIRVDNYQSRVLYNVQVTDLGADVDTEIQTAVAGLAAPSPNPATRHVRFAIQLRQGGDARLQVFDAAGRFVQGWESAAAPAGALTIDWDLRDRTGRDVPAGCYVIQFHIGPQVQTRTLVVVR